MVDKKTTTRKTSEVEVIERTRETPGSYSWRGSRLIWHEQKIEELLEITPPIGARLKLRLLEVARVWDHASIESYFAFLHSCHGGGMRDAWPDVHKFGSLSAVQFAAALINEGICGYSGHAMAWPLASREIPSSYPRTKASFYNAIALWKESEWRGAKRGRRERKLIDQLADAAFAHDGRKVRRAARLLIGVWEPEGRK